MGKHLKDVMSITKEYDPMNIDIDWIQEVSNEIPDDGVIPVQLAEQLCVKFARASEICGEHLAKLTYYLGKCQVARDGELGRAMGDPERSGSAAITREKIAKSDLEYVRKANRAALAEGCVEWFRNKKAAFDKYHYIAKGIIASNVPNFDSSPTDKMYGKIDRKH